MIGQRPGETTATFLRAVAHFIRLEMGGNVIRPRYARALEVRLDGDGATIRHVPRKPTSRYS